MSTQKKGTVIMLHGWAQNRFIMRSRTVKLEKKLRRAGYECEYLEAPHLLPTTSEVDIDGEVVQITNGKRENARAWFLYSKIDNADASMALKETPMKYIGLEASISRLKKYLEQNSDGFYAVLGFSQGATFGHILSQLVCAEKRCLGANTFCKIQCAVLLSGFPSMHNILLPDRATAGSVATNDSCSDMNDKLDLRSLHIYGDKDTSVPKSFGEKLTNLFVNPETYDHGKSHMIPHNKALIERLVTFLDSCYSLE